MIKIVLYDDKYKERIDLMLTSIANEFENPIRSPLKNKKTILPDPYWVALKGVEVVGTIALIIEKSQSAILKNMMLRQDVRGKEIGLSQSLLDKALHFCKKQQIEAIYLGTMTQFKAAQKFYRRNGFNEIPPNELPKEFIKNPLDTVFFCKKIITN